MIELSFGTPFATSLLPPLRCRPSSNLAAPCWPLTGSVPALWHRSESTQSLSAPGRSGPPATAEVPKPGQVLLWHTLVMPSPMPVWT